MCKRISYEFCCKEPFVVKHKTSYSCESAIYFNLNTDIINENCDFTFYYNKIDIIPTVFDGGNEIILANCQTINTLYALALMTFLLKSLVTHMFW